MDPLALGVAVMTFPAVFLLFLFVGLVVEALAEE